MIVDETDLKLIFLLYNLKKKEYINTNEIAKKICGNHDELCQKYTGLKNKLRKLSDYGLIKIKEDKEKREWILQTQKVDIKRMKFKDGFQKQICLKINNSWCTFKL